MIKKIINWGLLFALFIALAPIQAEAADAACSNGECVYGYYGSQTPDAILWADNIYHDDDFTRVKIQGSGQGVLQWFDAQGNLLGQSALAGYSDYNFPSGAKGFKIVASVGEFHALEAWSNNPLAYHTVFLGADSAGNNCIGCDLFNCPGWSQYMGKLDEIKSAIPPAPNWDQVAATFRDTIVPRLVTDMQTMLGTAPSPPAEPADLSGVDTGGIENQVSSMPDSGLDTSGFTKQNIENQAPEIPFRNDDSGGFDIVNPIDTLPSLPDKMPEPGNTDAGGWDAGHPQQPDDQPMPIPKDQSGTPDTGNAPIPSQNNDTPPSPGDNGGNAPIPNQSDWQGTQYYKKHPDDPDGSG
ncbi:hypothetical protein GGR02_001401 [Anoxybacillus voinovskiensis]|uniref:Uncharacterized protein n=1 Tax=Anoxybacteroides voinovskiense TaxID=230470 RepID=A0A840DVT5_9BACL|nr:hypothetical protein [Anoxybacillus voinovskiensis]MBB4073639.1 hypothetical protein [Anoxybacillus voinovskiensis]GGJ63395.1 hypothetical protein GCM10008982_10770 [Anoxybacillus voinovskiensis]